MLGFNFKAIHNLGLGRTSETGTAKTKSGELNSVGGPLKQLPLKQLHSQTAFNFFSDAGLTAATGDSNHNKKHYGICRHSLYAKLSMRLRVILLIRSC